MTTSTRTQATIAPTYPTSAADRECQRAASYVRTSPARTTPTDSDPNPDEALRRVRPSKAVS
jgi:hypothetical protein